MRFFVIHEDAAGIEFFSLVGLDFRHFRIDGALHRNDEVIDIMKDYFWLFAATAAGLGIAFCTMYFGQNYADNPIYRSPLFLQYGWFGSLAMIGGFAKFFDFSNNFTEEKAGSLYTFKDQIIRRLHNIYSQPVMSAADYSSIFSIF